MKLGNYEIGDAFAPYIIAEIGSNHNGDMDLCRKMIDAAVEAGAHCAKFQSWQVDTIVSKAEFNRNTEYGDSEEDKNRHFGTLEEMIETYAFRDEQHREIATYCKEVGIHFASSAFSEKEVDLLCEFDVPFLKIPSMDLNNPRLLRKFGSSGLPVLLSTGMGTLAEIEMATDILRDAGCKELVILHCRSIYPPKDHENDLRNITMLRNNFDMPIGFSDHSLGVPAAIGATALGACVIEKHFTTDKTMSGWDHWMSADQQEMAMLVEGTRRVHAMLGRYDRYLPQAELDKKLKFRRRAVAAKAMPEGHKITSEDVTFLRPGTGIHPTEESYLIGRVTSAAIDENAELEWSDFV